MPEIKIEKDAAKGKEIGVKRFYLPGCTIYDKCPNCGADAESDLAMDCIYYPVINKEFDYSMYCDDCETHWNIKLKIDITIGVAE